MVFSPSYSNQLQRRNYTPQVYDRATRLNYGYNHEVRGPQNILNQFNQTKPDIVSIANKGMSGLSKTLNGVQQVIRVVETTTPLIQQYGPFVKNLPMMLKMLKAFNDSETEEVSDEDQVKQIDLNNSNSVNISDDVSDDTLDEDIYEYNQQGLSTPKLFI